MNAEGPNHRGLRCHNRQNRSAFVVMLQGLRYGNEYVFHTSDVDPLRSMKDFRRGFFAQRRHLAENLQNPHLSAISLKTIRHLSNHGIQQDKRHPTCDASAGTQED
jgi:hypothetical protein